MQCLILSAGCDFSGNCCNLSFTIGYEKGYKLGYEAGYQAGYNDTYKVAYDRSFRQFQGRISDLENQIREAEKKNKFWFYGGAGVGAVVGLVVKVFTGGLF